jgi:hypothetical protein
MPAMTCPQWPAVSPQSQSMFARELVQITYMIAQYINHYISRLLEMLYLLYRDCCTYIFPMALGYRTIE